MSKIVIPETSHSDLKQEITAWLYGTMGPAPEYDDSLQPKIDEFGLPWFRAAALVVDADSKILMMHEAKAQVKKLKSETLRNYYLAQGHSKNDWVDEDGGWNIPAGRIMAGESFEEGLLREIQEESGHIIKLQGILCVRWGKDYAMPIYLAEKVSGPEYYQTAETLGICSFSVEGIRALNDAGILRSPESVMESLDAYEQHLHHARLINQIDPRSKL